MSDALGEHERLRLQRDLALALARSEDLDEALGLVLDTALRLTGADRGGGIYLFEGSELVLRAERGVPGAVRRVAADDPRHRLVSAGLPVLLDGGPAFPELAGVPARLDAAVLAVQPMRHRDTVIGCLNVASSFRDGIDVTARAALAALTGLCGAAVQRIADATELRRSRDAAEAAASAKTSFLAMMSHEIRTPMNGVVGAAELLLRTRLDDSQHELATVIRDSGSHLLALLGDILDFSRIEGGALDLICEPFEPRTLVDEAQAMVAERARAKGVALTSTVAADCPAQLVGDPQRIRQVLLNLLGNAVKFTDVGSIDLALTAHPAAAGWELAVRIVDTGVGIDPQMRRHLFQPFSQGTPGRRRGGTGLGLAISRRLVEAMGGAIEVDSEPGRGTRFTFTVRCAAAANLRSGATSVNLMAARPRRVLLVEDEAINRLVVGRMLAELGCSVETAEDGLAAIDRLGSDGIDLVVMDVQMPQLDGLEATRRLRAAGNRVPVIGASANAFAEDRAAALAAGMDSYLTKPLTLRSLAEAMLELPG